MEDRKKDWEEKKHKWTRIGCEKQFEVNEKMVELREKVNRQDQDAWNVDAPMEKLLLYVQKKGNSETVRLFSDALSLGFMRFDKINK